MNTEYYYNLVQNNGQIDTGDNTTINFASGIVARKIYNGDRWNLYTRDNNLFGYIRCDRGCRMLVIGFLRFRLADLTEAFHMVNNMEVS